MTGDRPEERANRFRMSVSDTTPDSRPDMRMPGREADETDGAGVPERVGVMGVDTPGGGTSTAGCAMGVAGALDAGLGASTTHILALVRRERKSSED